MGKVRKRATAQDQDLLVKEIEYETLDEIKIGDTHFRLVRPLEGKSESIQLWSGLSKKWNTTYRYNVESEWRGWKRIAHLYNKRKEDGKAEGSDLQSLGTGRTSRKKPGPRARSSSTKNGIGNKRRKSKNS